MLESKIYFSIVCQASFARFLLFSLGTETPSELESEKQGGRRVPRCTFAEVFNGPGVHFISPVGYRSAQIVLGMALSARESPAS